MFVSLGNPLIPIKLGKILWILWNFLKIILEYNNKHDKYTSGVYPIGIFLQILSDISFDQIDNIKILQHSRSLGRLSVP